MATDNSNKVILHLCADIGSDTKPYKDAGYNVIRIGRDIGVENYTPPDNVYGIIANPPCTMFSIARTNAKTPRDMKEGMRLVQECLRVIWQSQYFMKQKHVPHKLSFWAIENPATGYLKNYLGTPTYEYCPSDFGEDYTKKTALWGYFNPPKKTHWFKEKPIGASVSDRFSPMNFRNREERMHARSLCSEKFAQAFFEANK